MNTNKTKLNNGEKQVDLKDYSTPKLSDYGKMSELTEALAGPGTGCDGAYPSYLTSTSGVI